MPNVDAGRKHCAFRIWHYTGAIAAVFLALHVPYLPASLEDLDSINFALGLRDFDVTRHQPHPPGYPVYIAAGKAVRALVADEARALALVGIAAGGLGVFALVALFARIDGDLPPHWPVAAATLTAASPLYWLTAARPLSDVPGLAASVAVQALTLSATTTAGAIAAGFFSALVIGIRSQAAWLTLPLLIFVIWRVPVAGRRRVALAAIAAMIAGCAVWAVPLVVLTGGPAAYWRAVFEQGAEDLTGIQMLWTRPDVRQLASALYYALVAPWAVWQMAAGVLAAAAIGAALLLWRSRHALVILAVAFVPYFVFDVLFQETLTTRYALPLVVPVSYLAVRAVAAAPRGVGLTMTAGVVALNVMLAGFSLKAYASMPAPVFRMLTDMRTTGAPIARRLAPPVLAMHRRPNLDTRRPMQWAAADLPAFARRLPAPPKHEWLEVVQYWNSGGTDPVWFVADPMRTDLALVDHGASRVRTYDWPLQYPVLIGGVRPGNMQWHVFDSPGWYLGEGWALTPETAGVAEEDHRGPAVMPIEGWIRRRPGAVTLMIGGRNLALDGPPVHATVAIDGRSIDDLAIAPGAFLRFLRLPERALDGAGGYARISVAADGPRLAIEQFDAQSAGQLMFGFAEGWHELEYNQTTGRLWRWMSERGALRVRGPVPARPESADAPLVLGPPAPVRVEAAANDRLGGRGLAPGGRAALRLVLTGETDPLPRPSRVTVRVADRVIAQFTVGREFSVQALIPEELLAADESAIVVETDQIVVPAERSRRTADRRHLGLRVFDVQLKPAS